MFNNILGKIWNINSGIQFYCKEKSKMQQHFWQIIRSQSLRPLFFTIFKRTMCFLVSSNKILWKEIWTYSCFIFPLFREHLFSPGLSRATRLLETSYLEKITACVIETMLVTLPLVQMNKARREVNQQIKYKSTQDKIAIILRMCLNDWKKILLLFKLQFFVNQVVNLHIINSLNPCKL